MTEETAPVLDGNAIVHIAADTMLGDLMGVVLDELKAAPDVWQKLGEVEQDDAIDRIRRQCAAAVEDCVRIIATQGFSRIRAKVDAITVKDGIKATLTLAQHDPARHELVDAQGSSVFIVLADVEQFSGGVAAIHAEPDQQALTLGAIEDIGNKAKDDGADLDKAA